MSHRFSLAALAFAAGAALAASPASAADIRITCYSDGNECEVQKELPPIHEANPDIKVIIDQVPYKAILESLPVQLAAGNGPDIARVTDFGTISQYFLDMRPLSEGCRHTGRRISAQTLAWLRPTPKDKGIYGLPTQLTITGADRRQAPVRAGRRADARPDGHVGRLGGGRGQGGEGDERAARHGLGPQRPPLRGSGDLVSAQNISLRTARRMWSMTASRRWRAVSSIGTRTARSTRRLGAVRRRLSRRVRGVRRTADRALLVRQLAGPAAGEADRRRVRLGGGGDPCGPAACSGMPGGAAFVAFKQTKSPEEVAKFLDWLAQPSRLCRDDGQDGKHSRSCRSCKKRAWNTTSRRPAMRRSGRF